MSLESMLKAPKEGAGEADWAGAERARPGTGWGGQGERCPRPGEVVLPLLLVTVAPRPHGDTGRVCWPFPLPLPAVHPGEGFILS